MDEKDYQLNEEDLKKLQRKEAFQNDESYDIDVEESKGPSSPPVKEDKIVLEKPIEEEPEELFKDIDSKYLLTDEELQKIKAENLEFEPPVYDDTPDKTDLKSGKTENTNNREYLNRHETIFKEPEVFISPPKKAKNKLKVPKAPKVEVDYTNVATGFISIIFVLFIIFLFVIFWRLTTTDVKLSESEKASVIEMSTFLAYNEKYVAGMNELSEQKKTIIESYIKGTRDKKELALDILALRNKENQIIELFNADDWKFPNVKSAHDITSEYMYSVVNLSTSIVDMVGKKAEKGQLIDAYNETVESQTSHLYTLKEYVKNEINGLGVNTTTTGNIIQIDLRGVK